MSKITFPKFGEKHTFASLTSPPKSKQKLPKKLIIVFDTNLRKLLSKELNLSIYKSSLGGNTFITKDRKLAITEIDIGAPLTAATVDEAIAYGSSQFLILGVSGAISNKLSIGDAVLCTKTIRDEGVSHHYIAESKYVEPDRNLTSELNKGLLMKGLKFYEGTTWTIDAMYAETKEEVMHYRKENVLTVEMEASALFAVTKRRKAKSAAMFVILDILDKKHKVASSRKELNLGIKTLIEAAKIFKHT